MITGKLPNFSVLQLPHKKLDILVVVKSQSSCENYMEIILKAEQNSSAY